MKCSVLIVILWFDVMVGVFRVVVVVVVFIRVRVLWWLRIVM